MAFDGKLVPRAKEKLKSENNRQQEQCYFVWCWSLLPAASPRPVGSLWEMWRCFNVTHVTHHLPDSCQRRE